MSDPTEMPWCASGGCVRRGHHTVAGVALCTGHHAEMLTLMWGRAIRERFGDDTPGAARVEYRDRVRYVDRVVRVPAPAAPPLPAPERPLTVSLVYLATWDGNHVSVGVSRAPRQHLRALAQQAPGFRVLVAVPGDVGRARDIRRDLKPHRVGRASYRDCAGVRSYVEGLRAADPEWRSCVDDVAEWRSRGPRKGLPVVSELYCDAPPWEEPSTVDCPGCRAAEVSTQERPRSPLDDL